MWIASYLATLAKNTGWDRFYILWQLDYLVGIQLEHAYLRAEGIWTIPVQPPEELVTDDGVDDLLMQTPYE